MTFGTQVASISEGGYLSVTALILEINTIIQNVEKNKFTYDCILKEVFNYEILNIIKVLL